MKEVWEKPAPKKSGHTKATPQSKTKAKAAAKKAGRKYPNLVDSMNATKKQKVSGASKPSKSKGDEASSARSKAKP